ncbi:MULTISPECIES: ead/Ea22-like family protein [Klebsiella pneumoniae complex]|uniref:ead/Ea22-like family protein n=1 Tax=Klebsiella pneumoniae complex TaxID=3390273 RepID=UPI001F4A1510|nr:ead/Ea22-like family protein [Klebsiella pneumoniae]EKX4706430.1 ead/Ea22-like family protein [Klebsiella pneumoniae]MCM6006297.1 ead/Ea22-like family protein [Klebsiella pneumoniae]HBR6875105.1 ead/Ea22-like family protein [Klebsiella pneumoniae]HCA9720448.1 ead/Ea22-like family protein [Klebsiella pneumoniae]
MTTDITKLAQSLKNAASKALIEEGMTWFSEEQLSHEDGIALHKADAEFIALANPANVLALVEALEKAQQHIARQEQILLNQDKSLSIRRGELEAAQQERENWRTSFDNERFRADKLKAHIDEMTEERNASINELSRIIQKEVKAKREAEQRIAELEREQEHLRPVGVMSEKAFHRLENSECRFIALWPRPGIFLRRKRPEDGVIVYARTAAAAGIKVEAE